jgi:hypothetical protein
MRLFGWPRRPLSESPSCHGSALACSVASITELFRLESVGPSHYHALGQPRAGIIDRIRSARRLNAIARALEETDTAVPSPCRHL